MPGFANVLEDLKEQIRDVLDESLVQESKDFYHMRILEVSLIASYWQYDWVIYEPFSALKNKFVENSLQFYKSRAECLAKLS